MSKNYLNVVECAIEYDGRFLIIQRPSGVHAGGLLSFPGGKVEEQDETDAFDMLRSAAKREILEEVGLKLMEPLRYVTSTYFTGSNGSNVINTIFHCILKTNPQVNPSAREVEEVFWMTLAEINMANNSPVWLKTTVSLI
jgi:8-oxo-dGTP pyrophosphatase MutT (NUDIX family)